MKKTQKISCKFLAVLALTVVLFSGCEDDLNKTGFDLLLPGDLVSARKISVDKRSISSFTVTDEKLRTNKPGYSLLGTFNDPVFGKSTTDFAYQFRLKDSRDFKNALFDSLVLVLVYKETYGDRVTPQSLKVYELNDGLDEKATYYQDHDLKGMAKSEVLAEKMYVPKLKRDSLTNLYGSTKKDPKDTVIQEIRFNLNVLAPKLMAFDVGTAGDFPNDAFLQYFKGLYIEAGDLNQGGGIMRIAPSLLDEKKIAHNTEMNLYYRLPNDTNKYIAKYLVNSTSARTSRFVHDYTNTNFFANLDKLDQQDTLIYLQTTGGLSNKIYIPALNNWNNPDSLNLAINKAELILYVEPAYIDTAFLAPPAKLILSLINEKGEIFDGKGKLIFPSDVTFSELYYGGFYNKKDGTYRFNLAKHLQEINQGAVSHGFYLTTDDKNAIFRRVVLKGATSKTGIHFDITYSKIE